MRHHHKAGWILCAGLGLTAALAFAGHDARAEGPQDDPFEAQSPRDDRAEPKNDVAEPKSDVAEPKSDVAEPQSDDAQLPAAPPDQAAQPQQAPAERDQGQPADCPCKMNQHHEGMQGLEGVQGPQQVQSPYGAQSPHEEQFRGDPYGGALPGWSPQIPTGAPGGGSPQQDGSFAAPPAGPDVAPSDGAPMPGVPGPGRMYGAPGGGAGHAPRGPYGTGFSNEGTVRPPSFHAGGRTTAQQSLPLEQGTTLPQRTTAQQDQGRVQGQGAQTWMLLILQPLPPSLPQPRFGAGLGGTSGQPGSQSGMGQGRVPGLEGWSANLGGGPCAFGEPVCRR